ncbi:MAG: recombination protein NinG [Parabacteroides gordonii]|nr:recombination protein NinG [Parabacteroides gordonii]
MMYYIKRTKAKKKDKPLPLFDKAGVTVKKKPDLKAKLDKEFSLFIRLRDAMPNGYFKCISCGQMKPFEQADCGHYFSRTHLSTRFDENNYHAECRHCNRFKADHLEGYRENLIEKIGQQKFILLKGKASRSSKMTDFEYEQLIKYYKALNIKLRKEKGV